MPKIQQTSRHLKPYVCHGVDLQVRDGEDNVVGDCPFCGKTGKFSVEVNTGLWRCFVCGTGSSKGGGNVYTFLRELWRAGQAATSDEEELATDRKLLRPETLTMWEVVRSPITGSWLVPGYGVDGKLTQLYRYEPPPGGPKRVLKATADVSHAVHGVNLYDPKKSEVWVCEGPWDAMTLWELMGTLKYGEDGHLVLSSLESSLLKDVNVIAFPGANVFHEAWADLLAGKRVVMCYDSDHPRENNGKRVEPAGYAGMKRICEQLANLEPSKHPESIRCVTWGKEGYDPQKKSGWDLRDELTSAGDTVGERARALRHVYSLVHPIPKDWVKGRSGKARRSGSVDVETEPCQSWKALTNAWKRALKFTPDHEYALACVMACITSNALTDSESQLWIRLVSPPSSGKTTIVDGAGLASKHVVMMSMITGFHSGWKTDTKGDEDHSAISKFNGKTLITKDGDTLMKSANVDKVLAEARDIYDRRADVTYGNGILRSYKDLRMTWIICGTKSIRDMDKSELGERFLDVVMFQGIDNDLEREASSRAASRTLASIKSGGRATEDDQQQLTLAKQLTGGYVEYLHANAQQLAAELDVDHEDLAPVEDLAKLVAHMRARPGDRIDDTAEREFSTRLTSQLTRLALCLCLVMNRKRIDADVLRYVRRCALDTGRGVTMQIVSGLYDAGELGKDNAGMAIDSRQSEDRTRKLVRFLSDPSIGVCEKYLWVDPKAQGVNPARRPRWRLTTEFRELFSRTVRGK